MTHVSMHMPTLHARASYDATWRAQHTQSLGKKRLTGFDAIAQRLLMKLGHLRKNTKLWMKLATQVDAEFSALHSHDEMQLNAAIEKWRECFARGKNREEDLIHAAALVCELSRRELGMSPYVVQIAGALALFHGQVLEMATGEGKTLVAALGGVLLAWRWPSVHVVTANEYLAQRDAQWMGPLYRRAGVSLAAILPSTPRQDRARLYRSQVIYTTQKELVGDWLRDQLLLQQVGDAAVERLIPREKDDEKLFAQFDEAMDENEKSSGGNGESSGCVVPGFHVAIVDEADAVLIDNAVTPLILATARGRSGLESVYHRAAKMAVNLLEKVDFSIEPKNRRCRLTQDGKQKVVAMLVENDRGPWRSPRRRHELVEQALAAIHCYKRAVQYEMVDGQVTMIDEFTGRFQPDRHWQHGMHQAVQAKEGLEVHQEGHSLASVSFQRFFRMYPLLGGMTGTAWDAKKEFEATYHVPVRVLPTHRVCARKKYPSQVFVTSEMRWRAVVESIKRWHETGRPVLVGTRSVAASLTLSGLLQAQGLAHQVLNAIHHEQEASIIARAGERGAITVATNMAGRGTDIKLAEGVAQLGGLHVILTERHDASRIDRQLIGRSARQGEPGSFEVINSLEDSLLEHQVPLLAWLVLKLFRKKFDAQNDEKNELNSPMKKVRGMSWLYRVAQWRSQHTAQIARASILEHDDWLDSNMPL